MDKEQRTQPDHLPWGEAAAVYSAGLLSGIMLTVLGVVAARVLIGL